LAAARYVLSAKNPSQAKIICEADCTANPAGIQDLAVVGWNLGV
jgi:hypothetical protein